MECDVIKKNYFSVVRPFLEEKKDGVVAVPSLRWVLWLCV